jgi:hypothetical protein
MLLPNSVAKPLKPVKNAKDKREILLTKTPATYPPPHTRTNQNQAPGQAGK